jgi:hypothetical protein
VTSRVPSSPIRPFRAIARPDAWRFHAFLSLVLCLAGGCGGSSPFRSVERSIRDELPRLIGPADRYAVTVSRSGGGLLAGHIPWINIHGRNVRVVAGLNLDDLQVRLEDVRFSRTSRKVQQIGGTQFEAQVSAASVASYLHHRSPNLRDVQVAFAGSSVRVSAARPLLGIGMPFEVEGQPILRSPTAIDFAASRVAVLRLGLPEFAVRHVQERINPLVDLTAMPLPLNLTAVRVEGGRVLISGTAHLDPARLDHR